MCTVPAAVKPFCGAFDHGPEQTAWPLRDPPCCQAVRHSATLGCIGAASPPPVLSRTLPL